MTPLRRSLVSILFVAVVIWLGSAFWRSRKQAPMPSASATVSVPKSPVTGSPSDEFAPTTLYAHNLLLHKGPQFRVYIGWIRGEMVRTRRHVVPSFDDSDSFVLEIQKGVISVNIGDLGTFLDTSMPANAPLKHIRIQPEGDQIKLLGTVQKILPLPIELVGTLSPAPNGLVRFHVTKLDVLKIPLKGLLGDFHVKLDDLVASTGLSGVQIVGNDVLFDTQRLLPPPHIHGAITSVQVKAPDIVVVYGNARNDENRLAQWHNFLKLSGGSLDFGRLAMHPVDLTMIDASQDPWFDLDLVNYQAQLVNGYTRMTAQAGLEIFMPDLDEMAPKKPAQAITMMWLRDRNKTLPAGIPVK